MSTHHRLARPFRLPVLALIVCVLLVSLVLLRAAGNLLTDAGSPTATVARAWDLAQASGRYEYRSRLEQTIFPRASLANTGQAARLERFALQGSVDQRAERLELQLWQDDFGSPDEALGLRVDHGTTSSRQGGGDWQRQDGGSGADMVAPGGDPLGFLAGLRNVVRAGDEQRSFSGQDMDLSYTRYTFTLDGASFAATMRDKLEAQLRAGGKLPAGVTLDPAAYADLSGSGDLWLDSTGLPRRLTLKVDLPPQGRTGRVAATIDTEYFNFDRHELALASTTFAESPGAWLRYRLARSAAALDSLAPVAVFWLVFAALCVALVRNWRSRRVYAAVVITVLGSMLTVPQVQAAEMRAFAADQQAIQDTQKAAAARQDTLAGARAALATSNWDPHRDPLAAPQPPPPAAPAPLNSLAGAIQATGVVTSTDTDGDGLTDADEASWRTCPASSANTYCAGVVDPRDTDGDGLTDGAEVNALGTLPAETDTDGDTIPDNLEVRGFAYRGRTWYLDATNSDTNRDGTVDSSECPAWSRVSSASYNPNAICPDTDGDGTPNLFDDDNDGDSVHDVIDLSPETAINRTFAADNPLSLSISNLETNRPVLIDIQLRPTNPDHIQQLGNVLDWPTGDTAGQIQRRKNTTFASTTTTSARASDSRAANGDIRLVPMLEVQIPYTSGHYGNLPVKSGQPATRSLSTPLSTWLDTSKTDPYGVSIRQDSASSGDLTMLVPLTTVASETGDSDVAFSTQLLYWPSQGTNGRATWGAAQQVRLVWLVQMLTDECIDSAADPDTCARQDTLTVIHTYDDDWRLTGMQVSEEHGLDVGIVYEKPAATPTAGFDDNLSRDDELWMASWYLSNTFLTGRDCDTKVNNVCQGNGTRDVRVSTLRSQLDAWTGNSNYLGVQTFGTYDHSGYISTVMMTGTKQLLNTVFTPFASKTTPTLLFAQEKTQRQLSLDYATVFGGDVSFDLNPSSVSASTRALLSWSPYAYRNSAWQNMDVEDYSTALSANLAQVSFFQSADTSQNSTDVAEGKRIWAQMYYIALTKGSVGVVAANGASTWDKSGETLYEYSPQWDNRPSFKGASYVAGMYGSSIGAALYTKMANAWARYFDGVTTPNTSFWKQFKTSFSIYKSKYSVVNTIHSNTGRLINGTVAVLTVVMVSAVLMYGYGTLTGDQQLISIASYALNSLAIVMTTGYILTMLNTAYKASQAGLDASKILKFTKSSLSIGTGVTAIIFLTATWGPLIAQIAGGQLSGIQMEYAIAAAVASTIVFLIFTFLGSLPVVGLLLQILYLVDLILSLFNIRGAQDRITEWLASRIFTVESVITNFDDGSRLAYDITDASLVDPDAGFVPGNGMQFTVGVSTTLEHKMTIHDFIVGSFATAAAKKTTVRYYLQKTEKDRHGEFSLDGSTGDWQTIKRTARILDLNGQWRTVEYADHIRMNKTLTSPVYAFSDLGVGINRSLDNKFFLTEGYALPILTCWFYVGCDWDDQKGSNHMDLGQYLSYDILPATLDGFVAMDWGGSALAFPAQQDQDGDGLRKNARGGADPNDRDPDSDDDGLSDYAEFVKGTNALSADSDGDGMDDLRELFVKTDPLSRDTDGDGLSDYVEQDQGWLVGYPAADGTFPLTRVWSDPNAIDGDEDSLQDSKEFAFALNPGVPDDPSLIENLIQFNAMTVKESASPALLLHLEEGAAATAFADSSGRGVIVSCATTAGACPTAGASGRSGSAVSFDGTNDVISTTLTTPDLSRGSFTMAAWVKTTGNTRGIITKSDGDATWEAGERSFYLDNNSMPAFSGFGNGAIRSTVAVNDNAWHHVAVTWAYAGGTSGTAKIYVDGVDTTKAATTTYAATTTDLAGATLAIGRANNNATEASNPFRGLLDDVVVYDRALAASEVSAVLAGRFDRNDLVVLPGAQLTYQSTISNTHQTRTASGLLTAETDYIDPAVPTPDIALRFEAADRITTYSNSSLQNGGATCVSDQCPSTVWLNGWKRAALFDGANDRLAFSRLQTVDSGGSGSLSFSIKITSLPAAGQTAQIFETATQSGALSLYLTSAGKFVARWQGAASSSYQVLNSAGGVVQTNTYTGFSEHPSTSAFSPASGWISVVLNYALNPGGTGSLMSRTELKFNGGYDSRVYYPTVPSQALLGPGTIGANAAGGSLLSATLDEIASGFMTLGFEEDQTNTFTNFINTTSYGDSGAAMLTCASATACPTFTWQGKNNQAVTFDGVDDYLPLTQPYRPVNYDNGNISFWIKLAAIPAAGKRGYIIDNTCGAAERCFDIYVDSAGMVNYDLITNGVASNFKANQSLSPYLNQWARVSLDWSLGDSGQVGRGIYVAGSGVTAAASSASATPLVINPSTGARLGLGLDGTNGLSASIDDFVITGWLSGNYYTPYQVWFDQPGFDVAQLSTVSGGRAASCRSYVECPAAVAGKFGQALDFDGANDFMSATYETRLSEYTLAAWVKIDTIKAQNIIAFSPSSNTYAGVTHQLTLGADGRFNALNVRSATVAQANTWYHVAVVVGNDRKARLYVNGQEEGTPATVTAIASGAGYVYTLGAATYTLAAFDGALDELIISSAGTDAAGIRALMAAPYPTITLTAPLTTASIAPRGSATIGGSAAVSALAASGTHRLRQEAAAAVDLSEMGSYPVSDSNASNLAVFLPLDQPPGATSFNNLGQHSLAVQNPVATCSGTRCPISGVRGKSDRALYFDGVDDTISFAGVSNTDLAYQTLAAWVKADSEGGTILGGGDGSLYVALTTSNFVVGNKVLAYDLPDNVWTHVVAVYNRSANTAAVYLNGVLVASDSGMIITNSRWPSIGSNGTSNNVLKGAIDDVRIYMNVLTASQIQTLYQQSAAVMQFSFDEESGATVFNDSSTNGYAGYPSSQTCNTLLITNVRADRFNPTHRAYQLRLGSTDELLVEIPFPVPGTDYPVNASASFCGSDTLRFEVVTEDAIRQLVEIHPLDSSLSGAVHDSTSTDEAREQVLLADYAWGDPETIYNPLPGNDGKIGNTALFAAKGSIKVPGASAVGSLTNGFTVMGWVKPDTLSGSQAIVGSGIDLSTNGFGFGILNGKLRLNGYGRGDYQSTAGVSADTWQQVAVVFDSSNKASFYVDGLPKQSIQGSSAMLTNSDDPLYIGNNVSADGSLTDYFIGQIDELAVYPRALGSAELYNIYLRELRWFSDVASAYVKVDAGNPTVALLSSYAYRAAGYTQLAVQASDDSYVQTVDFGLKGPGMADYAWTQAPVCEDETGQSGGLWCPSFDSAALGGAGTYLVQFRATDAVGHQTTSAVSTLYVDGAGPVSSSTYAGGFQNLAEQEGDDLAWSVTLSGALSDPLVGAVAGSGVYTPTVAVALYDGRGEIAGTGAAQPAAISGATWTVAYRFAGAQPTGTYTIKVMAEDTVGNATTTLVGSISADERPASLEVDLNTIGESRLISETAALGGVVSEQANWGGELVKYHFEDAAGASFDDSGQLERVAACAGACPARVSGLFGQALRFSGGASLTVPPTDALDLDQATISAWIRPTWTAGAAGYNPVILAMGDIGGTRFRLSLRDTYGGIELSSDTAAGSVATAITPNQWTHIAVAQSGSVWTIYVNGVAVGTVDQDFEAAAGRPLTIGAAPGGLQGFTGDIDEVALYGRTLSADEIYALGRQNLAGVASAQIRLEPTTLTDPISDTLVNLHFEDVGHATFANAAGTTDPATCATCPDVADGLFGQALRFNGVDDSLTLTLSLTPTQYTLSTWVYPALADGGRYDVMGDAPASEVDRAPRLTLFENGRVAAGFGTGDNWIELATDQAVVPNGAWSQIAATFDGQVFNIYVNGVLAASTDAYAGHTPYPVSGLRVGGADTLFAGQLDEVRVYERALAAEEVALLADRQGASSWQNAAVSRANSLASAWTYALPANIEGYYLLHSRASDAAGNQSEQTTSWRGIIDTRAPVITASAALVGSGAITRTVYTVEVSDRFLDVSRLSQPCAGAVALSYGQDASQPIAARITCAINGWSQAPITIRACDAAGHCSAATANPQPAADPSLIGILSPASGAGFLIGSSITVKGAGYDPQGIQSINLFANQSLIASFGVNGATERSWQTTWQPQSTGAYTLTALMTDQQGAVLSDMIVIAINAASYQLSVARAGTGSGRVTSPAGIDCGSDCAELLPYGTQATLTAAPSAGSTFTRWSGACSSTQATCSVTLSQARSVTATFTLNTYNLTVSKTGTGSGAVSAPSGITCGAVCQSAYGHGTVVVLTAAPSAGASFAGWSGACSGTQTTCSVTMTQARSVTATFTRNRYALTVAVGGSGSGVVTSDPGGIICGDGATDCEETLDHGAQVTLTAAATPGSAFAGWSGGGCPENDPAATTCAITMDQAQSVTATFTRNRYALTVAVGGSGSGVVTSDPGGIICGDGATDCEETLDHGVQVTLTAAATPGSAFAGWSGGGCPENDPAATTCAITMDQARSVTALFEPSAGTTNVLAVTLDGAGTGRVTSDIGGLDCGAICSVSVLAGASVTLTAAAEADSRFVGWSGACAGEQAVCTVTMDQARTATATFARQNRIYLPLIRR